MKKTLIIKTYLDVSAMNSAQIEVAKDFVRAGSEFPVSFELSIERGTEGTEAMKSYIEFWEAMGRIANNEL